MAADTHRGAWPPTTMVIQSPSIAAGSIPGDQSSLALAYVADPLTALLALQELAPDAVVVPTDAIGVSVPEFVRAVRPWSSLPVVVALGNDPMATETAAEAVAAGCSGLLSVPFTTRDLVQRLTNLLGLSASGRRNRGELAVAGLTLDFDAMRVHLPDEQVASLSSLQLACLARLMQAAPSCVTTEELADELGIVGDNIDDRTRRVVYRLRRRLIAAGGAPTLVQRIRGRGYRLQPD